MTPIRLLKTAIMPALDELATLGIRSDIHAARFMLAIALQESNLAHRRQIVSGEERGPASSFWQFEKNGGCLGVLSHPKTALKMTNVCSAFNVKANPASLWEAMRFQDIVAACAARLLIYSLPRPLPENAEEGWSQYISAWRPGMPHPEKWADFWRIAGETVGVK